MGGPAKHTAEGLKQPEARGGQFKGKGPFPRFFERSGRKADGDLISVPSQDKAQVSRGDSGPGDLGRG